MPMHNCYILIFLTSRTTTAKLSRVVQLAISRTNPRNPPIPFLTLNEMVIIPIQPVTAHDMRRALGLHLPTYLHTQAYAQTKKYINTRK